MMSEISDHKFLKAYRIACNTEKKFPPDIMLQFYAYYKRGTQHHGIYCPPGDNEEDLRNGFKANALRQVENLSPVEAKEKYIELVEKHIGEI